MEHSIDYLLGGNEVIECICFETEKELLDFYDSLDDFDKDENQMYHWENPRK
jgi:hypothetical protein